MKVNDIYFDALKKKLLVNYTLQGFAFSAFNEKEEVLNFLVSQIAIDASIIYGDSATLEEIGIFKVFGNNKYKNFFRGDYNELFNGIHPERLFAVDIYLTSSNAATLDGILVNIDQIGNRVAPMLYGPKKVYVICGINKLTTTREEALSRVSNTAAVINNVRLHEKYFPKYDNPCVKNMRCVSCKSEDRICVYTTIIRGCYPKERIHVIFVNENLGF